MHISFAVLNIWKVECNMKQTRIGTSHASIDIKWNITILPQTQAVCVTSTIFKASIFKQIIYSLYEGWSESSRKIVAISTSFDQLS